jgi:hypothetical protein
MAKNKVEVQFTAVDKMSKKIKGIKGELDKIPSALQAFGAGWLGLQGLRMVGDLAKLSAQSEKVGLAFKNMAKSIGADSNILLDSIKKASGGTIAEMELMKQASKAVTLGIPVDKIAEMMEIARASSVAMGESVEYMFESIVTGTARQSKLILDNLGIIVDQTSAYKKISEELGRELSEVEKRQIFVNEVIGKGQKIIRDVGDAINNTSMQYEMLGAGIIDLKVAIGDFINAIIGQSGAVDILISSLKGLVSIVGTLTDYFDNTTDAAQNLIFKKIELKDTTIEVTEATKEELETQRELLKIQEAELAIMALRSPAFHDYIGGIKGLKDLYELLNMSLLEGYGLQVNTNAELTTAGEKLIENAASIHHIKDGQWEINLAGETQIEILGGINLKQKAISGQVTQQNLAIKLQNAEYDKLEKERLAKIQKRLEEQARLIADPIISATGLWVRGLMEGEQAFKNIGEFTAHIIKQLAAMIIQATIFASIMSVFTGGGFGGLFGRFLGFHKGGMIPKAHTGIFASDERLILAQTGESVLTRQATQSLGGKSGIDYLNSQNRLPDIMRGAGGRGVGSRSANININIQGDFIGEEAFVRAKLVPIIEDAADLGKTTVETSGSITDVEY